jgi:hypothetical protein
LDRGLPARDKINGLFLKLGLAVAALLGLLTGSFLIFALALAAWFAVGFQGRHLR